MFGAKRSIASSKSVANNGSRQDKYRLGDFTTRFVFCVLTRAIAAFYRASLTRNSGSQLFVREPVIMTKALRWNMAILITAAIAISYFDRQTLPIAIRAIQQEIPVTNGQFSHLQAAFLAAYALMYAGSGKLIDVLGTRRGFLLIMIWWSLACASQGLATSVPMLAVALFLLGMG